MVPDFETELAEALAVGDTARAVAAVADWRTRARAFVQGRKRARGIGGAEPQKKKRRGAAALGLAVDNSLLAGAGIGLAHFRVPEVAGVLQGDPFSWPRLGVAVDQGSDCVALVNALKYAPAVSVNVCEFWDMSHGA